MTPITNRTVVQRSVGAPAEAVAVEETDVPVPGEGELLVELVVAPINPAEILMSQGEYGYRETVPALPRPAGIEGVGRVVGGATHRVPTGSLVSLAGTPAVFSDYRVLPADRTLVIDPDIDADAFALGFVNMQAVLLMFEEWPEVQRGDWIVQNAGNSGYGRILDAVGERRGVGVVNIVRSESAAVALRREARGPVVIDGGDLDARVQAVTGGIRPKVAVDAVGGSSTGRLAETLPAGGRVVTYGCMSGEDIHIDTRLVLFHGIRVEGFWMPRSMARLDAVALGRVADEAMALLAEDIVHVPVEARYPLDRAADAMARAAEGGRRGKIVLTR